MVSVGLFLILKRFLGAVFGSLAALVLVAGCDLFDNEIKGRIGDESVGSPGVPPPPAGGGGGPTVLAPKIFAYKYPTAKYITSVIINPNTPRSFGGTPSAFTVTPALPGGLSLDAGTGVISGTPSAPQGAASYTVRAENSGGYVETTLSIEITAGFVVNTTSDGGDLALNGLCDIDAGTPGEQCSLRAAVQEANSVAGLQTIWIPDGFYSLGSSLPTLVGDLNIQGESQAGVIIDGGSTNSRRFLDVNGPALFMSHLTVQNMWWNLGYGAAFLARGAAQVTMEDVTFRNNINKTGAEGGAIFMIDTSSATIRRSHFSENTTVNLPGNPWGGAIALHTSGSVTIEESFFHKNSSGTRGGAVRISPITGAVTISGCIFTLNIVEDAIGIGGAIDVNNGSTIIENTYFSENRSGQDGGALSAGSNAVLEIRSSTFFKNTAGARAGGAISTQGSTMSIKNSAILYNVSEEGGGAIQRWNNGSMTLENSIVYGNLVYDPLAGSGGAGATNDNVNHTLLIRNSIVAGNLADGVVNNCEAGNTSVLSDTDGHNLTDTAAADCLFDEAGDIVSTDPAIDLRIYQDELTAPYIVLLAHSPAIDAGNDATCLASDSRGQARVDLPSLGTPGTSCDIGPSEKTSLSPPQSLSFDRKWMAYLLNEPVHKTIQPTFSGTADYFSVSPDLPAGLTLDSDTGAILGTPTQKDSGFYEITAWNDSGAARATLEIMVVPGFKVTTTTMGHDANFPGGPWDGVCDTGGGVCSIKAAVEELNAQSEPRLILLGAGTFNFAMIDVLNASRPMYLMGSGATTTLFDGLGSTYFFTLDDSAWISDMTFREGVRGNGSGGALDLKSNYKFRFQHLRFINNFAFNSGTLALGGAIMLRSNSDLEMDHGYFSGNFADNGGGAICPVTDSPGRLIITNSNFEFNNGGTGAGGAIGGYNGAGGESFYISNSTFSHNESDDVGGAIYTSLWIEGENLTFYANSSSTNGGAIYVAGSSQIRNATFSDNEASASGDAIYSTASDLHIGNSIFHTVSGANDYCGTTGTITSLGGNIATNTECSIGTGPSDQPSTAITLGALSDNGGAVPTMAVTSSSPAVDAGFAPLCSGYDARGLGRPADGNVPADAVLRCDAGAFELQ